MIKLIYLKNLRLQAGMSQQQMATFLKTSRSYVAMVEKGYRSLAISSLKKLGDLEETLKYAGQLKTDERLALLESNDNMLKQLEETWKYKLKVTLHLQMKAEHKLVAMVRMYDETLNGYNSYSLVLAQMPKDTPEHYRVITAYHLLEVQHRLATCNEACQLKLKGKIAIYEAEARIFRNLVNETPDQKNNQRKKSAPKNN